MSPLYMSCNPKIKRRCILRKVSACGKRRYPISKEEAEAIVAQNNKTGKEFVDSIYKMLGMERPERTPD